MIQKKIQKIVQTCNGMGLASDLNQKHACPLLPVRLRGSFPAADAEEKGHQNSKVFPGKGPKVCS